MPKKTETWKQKLAHDLSRSEARAREEHFDDEVNAFVTMCFARLSHLTHAEIARASGLSMSTVYRLWNLQASVYTRVGTLQKLGDVADLRLDMIDEYLERLSNT